VGYIQWAFQEEKIAVGISVGKPTRVPGVKVGLE